MLDLGWSEIAVIAVLALVVIGPKDLPRVLRTVGRWVRRIRAMGGEFQKHMDDVMRESGVDEVRKQVNTIARTDIGGKIDKVVDPDGSLAKSLRDDPSKKSIEKQPTQEKAPQDQSPQLAAPLHQGKREEGAASAETLGEGNGDSPKTTKATSAEQQQ
ncbi:Sec-independent protein translocase protein TatB [Rhodospirillum sp. A1_3_36]|uniref:Sec-independent protein translocase protein TatB n=1 Tax=Rhodospirillum sp. A1_3_36 TaxID=3391666 RepID=UPI0039A65ECB